MKAIPSVLEKSPGFGRNLLPLVLFLTPVLSHAQETETSTSNQPNDETVVQLSPFEVTSEKNVGYLANNSLAGTRINASLRDIANSVQVVTKEFLEDSGATNYGELLTFTTSTEVGGAGGNATLDNQDSGTVRDEFSKREPQRFTRVRGLARLDLTRDYFAVDMGLDTYNTSEVTINRGPNASLFGLGSPGGISNAAIDKADTGRTFGEVNFRGNEYGGTRFALNYNQMVLKNTLAVRVAALDNNQKFEQNAAYYDDERYFVAATWRPLKNFAIRANYENGSGFGSRPTTRLPTDRITPWIENGKPSYNPLTREWFINGAKVTDRVHIAQLNAATIQYATMSINGNPAIIFDDPNSSTPGTNGYAAIQAGLRGNAAGRTSTSLPVTGDIFMRQFGGFRQIAPRDPDYIVGARPDISAAELNYYNDVQLNDLSVFNSREQSLNGQSDWQSQEFEVSSFRMEKTWLDNAVGLELAYQQQHYESNSAANQTASSGGNLSIDINLVLLDGSPNPNYGRPFVGGRGFSQARIRDREAAQAIGFAKYEFSQKHDGFLKWLGNHTLTAVYQDQSNDELQPNRTNARADNSYNSSLARGGPGLTQANNAVFNGRLNGNTRSSLVQYLGPSAVGANSIQDVQIQGVTALQEFQNVNNALRWNPYNARFETGPIEWYNTLEDPEQTWIFGNPRARDEIQSLSAVLQSEFLNDHIVTTASWRQDAVKNFVANGEVDPATGLHTDAVIPLGDPTFDDTVEQTSFGIVGHMPDRWLPKGFGLSAHYVDSQNFAAGSAGRDIFNNPAELQSGTTKEYGLSFSALNNKIYARLNFFETNQIWEPLLGVQPQIGNTMTLVMENNTPAQLAAVGWNLYDGSVIQPGTVTALNIRPLDPNVPNNETDWLADNIAGTSTNYFQDTNSEGLEFELTYAPTTNWRLAFNASEVESRVSNVMPIAGPELTRVATEVYLHPQWRNLFIVPNPTLQPNGAYLPNDLLSSASNNLLSAIALRKAREGGPLQEIRKWRYNVITNYSFRGANWRDSWLSGFGVGAALRWQDKIAIGQGLKVVDGATVPDFDNQYYGPAETNVDTWVTYNTRVFDDMNLRIELRVRNVTSGDGGLIPVAANPDGEIALWRLGQPLTFEFSGRLEF